MFPVTSRTGQVGLFISVVGKNTTWLNLMPKKRVRGENSGELLRNKLYKSVHKCIGNIFF